MPYPNEHSARQRDPSEYSDFRKFTPKGFPDGIYVVLGLTEDGGDIQSVRADSATHTIESFRSFLKENGFLDVVEEATKKALDLFSTWVPLDLVQKGSDDSEEKSLAYIKGVVSTDDTDFEGERVEQRGLDWSYFLKHGWFNHEHRPGPEAVLGHPLKVDADEHATTVEGVLYLDKPLAKEVYTTAVAMKKAGGERTLGFSIEGQVTARNDSDKQNILGAKVINCAITAHPMNPNTNLEVLMRGMDASVGYQSPPIPDADASLSALVEQSLAGKKTSATYGDGEATISLRAFRSMMSTTFSGTLSEEAIDALFESLVRYANKKA